MARREYDANTKAAVMAALLAGQGTQEVAAQYNIPPGTVDSWRHRMNAAPPLANLASEKREAIGDLLIDYLRENLTTLKAQVVAFRDPTWLAKQGAADAAVLHGVLTDKSIRLLDAMGGPHESNAPAADS